MLLGAAARRKAACCRCWLGRMDTRTLTTACTIPSSGCSPGLTLVPAWWRASPAASFPSRIRTRQRARISMPRSSKPAGRSPKRSISGLGLIRDRRAIQRYGAGKFGSARSALALTKPPRWSRVTCSDDYSQSIIDYTRGDGLQRAQRQQDLYHRPALGSESLA